MTFRAHWPRFKDGRQWTPRKHLAITCSAGRDPRALAREIERRLLVDYEPTYREALDYVRESDAAADDARCTAERIAVAIGAELPREGSYQQQRRGARGSTSMGDLPAFAAFRSGPATATRPRA